MTNISLTSACNADCAYCFARPAPGDSIRSMSRSVFLQCLDFLERSGQKEARLLGGEPTLHPDFGWIVDRIEERGLDLTVFSNGDPPPEALGRLEKTRPENTTILINYTAAIRPEKLFEVCRRLGPRAALGLTLIGPGPLFEFPLDLISRLELRPLIRLGLAHPAAGAWPGQFAAVRSRPGIGAAAAAFTREAAALGLAVDFDCGSTPCMFPDPKDDLIPADIGLRCNPLPDVLPDGRIISCYPLADLGGLRLADASTAAEVRFDLEKKLAPYRQVGLKEACSVCSEKEAGTCGGGCLASARLRLQRHDFSLTWPPRGTKPSSGRQSNPDSDRKLWSIPYVDLPIGFWEETKDRYGDRIREVYFALPGPDAAVGSGRPRQPEKLLFETWRRSSLPFTILINPVVLPRPAKETAGALLETLKRLDGEYGLAGAVVSDPTLAEIIKTGLPHLPLTASVLMDLCDPVQLQALPDVFDSLVPSSRIMRRQEKLVVLKESFPGRIRLLVNEGCLPGCPHRVQHFFEMQSSLPNPESLCRKALTAKPWLRLTGAWVLPQHLHFYDDLCHDWKLAGRVTLQKEDDYRRVLSAYLDRKPLSPDRIGAGPAAPLSPIEITDDFFQTVMNCDLNCPPCRRCPEYWAEASRVQSAAGKGGA